MASQIEIIGTSHIARESLRMINRKILNQKPEIVAVELDQDRLAYLFMKPRSIRLSDIHRLGFVGFTFGLIGGFVQRKLGEKVGLAPGADIRAAIRSAEKVGAKIFLIDRPLELTLQRLSQGMSSFEKLKFIFYLFAGFFIPAPKGLKKIDLRKVPEEHLIRLMTSTLRNKFPIIYKVLVQERDDWMADKIIKISNQFPNQKIVVVVGAGHIQGLRRRLEKHAQP